MNYRLYAFVANHYLSPLQCGLQTAHVVSELAMKAAHSPASPVGADFGAWAHNDKTIIICGAGNHQGVLDCYAELKRTAIDPGFALGALFREDEQSMNGMATACGVIVPEKYWAATFSPEVVYSSEAIGSRPTVTEAYWTYHNEQSFSSLRFPVTHPEGQFISHIKSYRLA